MKLLTLPLFIWCVNIAGIFEFKKKMMSLIEKYSPSEPCSCQVCLSYCVRPGWWTVEEARNAIAAGYAHRMMIEMAPEMNFAVLSPAFKGNEGNYSLQIFSKQGCTFLKDNLCELFGTGFQPLECRFCHHDRKGQGIDCHTAIEHEWNSHEAKRLIVRWGNETGFWERQNMKVVEK
jgi:hypothetical protein